MALQSFPYFTRYSICKQAKDTEIACEGQWLTEKPSYQWHLQLSLSNTFHYKCCLQKHCQLNSLWAKGFHARCLGLNYLKTSKNMTIFKNRVREKINLLISITAYFSSQALEKCKSIPTCQILARSTPNQGAPVIDFATHCFNSLIYEMGTMPNLPPRETAKENTFEGFNTMTIAVSESL